MNNIAKFKKYIDLLDEVYKQSSKTQDLDGDTTLVRAGANTNEIIVPKLSMDGLADYSRNSGYISGDVNFSYETVKFNYDRGRKFTVDAMDNEETAGLAFGKLSSEFLRTKVVPEVDAFRFATYAGTANIGKATGNLSTGADVVAALRAAANAMDEAEVNAENRILFITPTLKGKVDDLDTNKSKEVFGKFSKVVEVPQSRFYTAIDLLDGSSDNELIGGYRKHVLSYVKTTDTALVEGKTYYTKSGDTYSAVVSPDVADIATYYEAIPAGQNINFMVIEKSALLQYPKHKVNKIIDPEANQTSDGWMFFYREYGLADVYENKTAGIYVHSVA